MASAKSIFEALNKMREDNSIDEDFGAINRAGIPIKHSTADKISGDEDKVAFVKKNRKSKTTKVKIRQTSDNEYNPEDDEVDSELQKRGDTLDTVKSNVEIEDETEEEEIEKNKEEGTVKEKIDIDNEDMEKVFEILKALDVPVSIINSFNESNFDKVFSYLKEHYGIKFEMRVPKEQLEKENSIDESRKLFTLKEGIKFGVVESGYGTTDVTKWDSSVVIYEGGKDKIALEKIDDNSFNFVFKEENINKKITINKEEISKILI